MSEESEVRLECLRLAYQWGAAGIFRDEVGELTPIRVLALARRLVEFALISKPPWPVGP